MAPMLTPPLPSRLVPAVTRRGLPLPGRLAAAAIPLLLALPGLGQAEMPAPDEVRPRGMALVLERVVPGGRQAIGVYGVTPEPNQPGLFRVKVWDERPNTVLVRNETIRCRPSEPLRVTTDGQRLFVRSLNPGGPITPANRIDHLIWWATCFPDQAGKDPAGLGPVARQLGYSGALPESEQVVPAGGGGR